MEWIKFSDKMPETDIIALVSNAKGWMSDAKAIYHKRENVWVLSDPNQRNSYTLEVTHYLTIPQCPRE